MPSISSMAASSGLAILTNMTQSKTEANPQSASTSILTTASSASGGAGRAEKSVSSAIFNAVVNSAGQDDTINAVLNYIDDTYNKEGKRFANFYAEFGKNPEVAANLKASQDLGEGLKQLVLSDPEGVKQKLSTIMKGRPDISRNDAMSFLVNELIEDNPAVNAANLAATQPSSTDPAEGAMDLVARIQTEMGFYQSAVSAKQISDLTAMTEQAPITQVSRGLAAGKDISELMAQSDGAREAWLALSTQLSEQNRQTADSFAGRIRSLTDKLSQYATIEGDLLVKKEDGTYDLGTFRVQDKSGTVTFFSDAGGQITYTSPRHDQSYYGGFN